MKQLPKAAIALLLAIAMMLPCAYAQAQDDVIFDPEEVIEFLDSMDEHMLEERRKVSEMRNILLIGIDARPGETTGRSDTMIIVTLDPDNNTIKLTSLMRDLYVEIPGHKNNRINAAYVFGGAELLMETIERNFGVHIEHYIAVNFSMLASLIDEIGGLTLTVESDYYKDRINAVIKEDNKVLGIGVNEGLLEGAGEQVMTGKQAQAYARYRYGTKDGDFGRTERQREVILKIFDQLSEKTALELMTLAVNNASNVYTNLSVSQIAGFAPVMLTMRDAQIAQLRLPVDGGYSDRTVAGMSVLVPDRKKNVDALVNFLGE
ncbi:MAG: LCP family protein [Christensenellales bacterium]|jgi:LCP family protein required for cell wall assembly